MRERDFRRKYGIGTEDYQRLHEAQNGCCAICRQPESWKRDGKVVALSVDHNHADGSVRELLCYQCNTALGKVRESEEILEAMLAYVRKHKR